MSQTTEATVGPFGTSNTAFEWDADDSTYFGDQANSVSHSDMEVFRVDPAMYHQRFIAKTKTRKSTRALDIGHLFHDVVLGLPYECDRSNYRHHTIALWKPCETPNRDPDAVSESRSRCWHTSEGVVRESSHWGRVHSCYWELEGMKSELSEGVGLCRWDQFLYDTKHFAPIPRDVLNSHGHRKGGAWTEWAEVNHGTPQLKAVEDEEGWSIIPEMVAAIRQHAAANQILFRTDGQNEVAIKSVHKETGLVVRGKLDAPRPGVVIGDLKSIRGGHCSPRQFATAACSLGYHRQAATYQDLWFDLTGERLPFVFIGVDKTSCRVECFELDDQFIELGRRENNETLQRMAECFQTGKWVSPTHGRVVRISAPKWASYEQEWEYQE